MASSCAAGISSTTFAINPASNRRRSLPIAATGCSLSTSATTGAAAARLRVEHGVGNMFALEGRGRRGVRGQVVSRANRAVTVGAARAAAAAATVPAGSVSIILLAGGVGKRMGANMPKQYLPLKGQPIALYSMQTFAAMEEVGEIVVVCDPSYRDLFEAGFRAARKPLKFALPGKERQDSVASGLAQIAPSAALVAVHDSARPLVTSKEVSAVMRDAMTHGAAALGVQTKATIKQGKADQFVDRTLDRSVLWEMHTPQVVRPQLLRDGFALVARDGLAVTDDASIVEALGQPVFITKGEYTNLKVTTPEDMFIAERLMDEASAKK